MSKCFKASAGWPNFMCNLRKGPELHTILWVTHITKLQLLLGGKSLKHHCDSLNREHHHQGFPQYISDLALFGRNQQLTSCCCPFSPSISCAILLGRKVPLTRVQHRCSLLQISFRRWNNSEVWDPLLCCKMYDNTSALLKLRGYTYKFQFLQSNTGPMEKSHVCAINCGRCKLHWCSAAKFVYRLGMCN